MMQPVIRSVTAQQHSSGICGQACQYCRQQQNLLLKYNALNQRITKNGPLSSKFMFFYDPAGQLIGEYKDNASTTTSTDDWLVRQETIWLDDIPVAVIRKPTATGPIQIYYIHADHLNTPRVIVNTANTIVWRWENTHVFGANLPDEDPDGNAQLFEYHQRFPGQYFDRETNLHYNYFRYYEPETGRYISPDPIGLAGGINIYGYVKQNPLSFIDSDGLLPDAIVDLGLIAFDIASYAYNKVRGCDTSEDIASLKANTVGLLIPGVTGLGLGVRRVDKVASMGLGRNPFKGKTNEQIIDMFKKKGFEAKVRDPSKGLGTDVNPKTGRP